MNSVSILATLENSITVINLPLQCQSGKWGAYIESAQLLVSWANNNSYIDLFTKETGLGSSSFKLGINAPMEIFNQTGQQLSVWSELYLNQMVRCNNTSWITVYKPESSDMYNMALIGGSSTLEVGLYDDLNRLVFITKNPTTGFSIKMDGVTSYSSAVEIRIKLIEIK